MTQKGTLAQTPKCTAAETVNAIVFFFFRELHGGFHCRQLH